MKLRVRAWARKAFKLEAPQPDGATLRDHLQSAKDQGAPREVWADLETPKAPVELHFVLPMFRRLSATRPYTEAGPLAIPDSAILVYGQLRQQPVRPEDVELLEILDAEWLTVMRGARTA